jgi:hypothetical protein
MIEELIHEASLLFGLDRQISNASVQIPRVTSIAEDFKYAVAEDQQARARRDATRPSWKFYTTKHTHHHAGGRKEERIRFAWKQHDRRGMTASGPSHRAVRAVVNTVLDREKSLAVLFALEGVIEFGQHLIGLLHVGPR